MLDKNQWPYWTVAALATSNHWFLQGPVQGCDASEFSIPAFSYACPRLAAVLHICSDTQFLSSKQSVQCKCVLNITNSPRRRS